MSVWLHRNWRPLSWQCLSVYDDWVILFLFVLFTQILNTLSWMIAAVSNRQLESSDFALLMHPGSR